MAASIAPSTAAASCCGIANLTFVSQGTAAGGKRLWKVAGQNVTDFADWDTTLKASCSTPIPDVRIDTSPPWYGATCGPRALCQRMGGDDMNATSSWTFGCECEYDYADPIGAARFKADGLTWDGDGICRDVTPSGLITLVTYSFNVLFYFCILAYACVLAWRLYAKNRDSGAGKSLCQIKLLPQVIGVILHVVLLTLCFVCGVASALQGMNGGDPRVVFDLAIGLLAPLSVTAILTLLVVALSWVSLASNAKTFRKTSPASAQRKANTFVGVMAGFCLVSVVLFNLILKNNALGTVCTALASLVVMITYLVGSIKLTAVMNGSKSVARQLKIVQLAARRIVFWLGIYFLSAGLFAVSPHNSIPRATVSFFLFHAAGHLSLVVLWYYEGAGLGGKKGAGVAQSAKASAHGSVTPGTTRGSAGTATGDTMVTATGGTVGEDEMTVGDEVESDKEKKGGSPRVLPLKD